jgi:hypothetical protein
MNVRAFVTRQVIAGRCHEEIARGAHPVGFAVTD